MSGAGSITALGVRLRREPAVWMLPASCVLAYLAATGLVEQSVGYPLALAVRGHVGLMVLAPIAAGCAAWKAGRYRRAGWTRRAWRRRPLVLGLSEVGLTGAVQLVAYIVVRAWTTVSSPSRAGFTLQPQLLAVAVAVLLGWTSLGSVIGWFVRTELALPIAVAGSYLTIVFPGAMEPLWLRHMTGIYDGCCQQNTVLDAGAIRGSVVISLGVMVAALLLLEVGRLSKPMGAIAILGAVGLVVASAVVAVHQVDHLGADPVRARIGRVVCAGTGPEVCVWPEDRAELPRLAEATKEVFLRWSAQGLEVPGRVAPRLMIGGRATLVDSYLAETRSLADVAHSLASEAVPQDLCDYGSMRLDRDQAVAEAWVAVIGGMPFERAFENTDDHLQPQLKALIAAPRARRLAWLHRVQDQLGRCIEPLPPIPK